MSLPLVDFPDEAGNAAAHFPREAAAPSGCLANHVWCLGLISHPPHFYERQTTTGYAVRKGTLMALSPESGAYLSQNLRRHDVAALAVLLAQRFGGGHNAPCGDGTPTRMACEKFGERPSSCALAAMCAADRSCDKETEVSSAPRS